MANYTSTHTGQQIDAAVDKVYDLHENELTPIATKTYTSSSYYASSNDSHDAATWYMLYVHPSEWYKPWKIKVKFTTTCAAATSYRSTSWCEIYGRENSITYHIFNERYNTAHYYIGVNRILKAGFDQGYGIAVGVDIVWSSNYNSSSYPRTFKMDLLSYEDCTIDVLDTPLKNNQLAGYSSSADTYRYRNLTDALDAVNRGLRESGDDNTTTQMNVPGFDMTIGANLRLNGYGLFGIGATGLIESFGQYGTGESATIRTIANNDRLINPNGIDWRKGIFYSNTNADYATNARYANTASEANGGIDLRYTFNCVASNSAINTLGIERGKPIYLRGYLKDGLFYFLPLTVTYNSATYYKAYTQTIPTQEETTTISGSTYRVVYWLLGYPYYNSSYGTMGFQINLSTCNDLYIYINNKFKRYDDAAIDLAIIAAINANY